MATMGHGYGSEFHLLRWMGRHRKALNQKVEEITGLAGLEWLDFEFKREKDIPDEELKGLNFLSGDSRRSVVLDKFRSGPLSWPQGGELMNWDAVGRAGNAYVLCEAKAHVGEIVKRYVPGDSPSVEQRNRAFAFAKTMVGADPSADWMHNFYQMANRLYILALLTECEIEAILLNVYFCGDRFRGRECPESREGWETILKEEYGKLGIDEQSPFFASHVKNLFLSVDSADPM